MLDNELRKAVELIDQLTADMTLEEAEQIMMAREGMTKAELYEAAGKLLARPKPHQACAGWTNSR